MTSFMPDLTSCCAFTEFQNKHSYKTFPQLLNESPDVVSSADSRNSLKGIVRHGHGQVLPECEHALLLLAHKQPYTLVPNWPTPRIESENEVLVKILAIGLNPVDWKSCIYGIAIPSLPAITGRDLAGIVVSAGREAIFKPGTLVFGPSTQYRDYRSSAFQEYAVLPDHCLSALPIGVTTEEAAGIGVAAAAAVLTLSSSFGVPLDGFSSRCLSTGAEGEEESWEVERLLFHPSRRTDEMSTFPHFGKWLLIWGGSTVSGFFIAQLALMAGMKVIAVADISKHASRLKSIGIQHIFPRSNPLQTISQIRALTSTEGLTYSIDCVGPETARFTIQCLSPLPFRRQAKMKMVGLCGLPKDCDVSSVEYMNLPIKTLHTNPAVGRGTMDLIWRLVSSGRLKLPDVEVVPGGLGAVNPALDRLKRGAMGFGRLVVKM